MESRVWCSGPAPSRLCVWLAGITNGERAKKSEGMCKKNTNANGVYVWWPYSRIGKSPRYLAQLNFWSVLEGSPGWDTCPRSSCFERDRIGAQHARQNTDETFGMHHGDSGSLSWCIYFINVSGILSEEWYSARSVWNLPVIPWSSISSGVPFFFFSLFASFELHFLFIYFPVAGRDQNHLDVSNITIFYKCSRSLFLAEKKKESSCALNSLCRYY